MDKIESVEALVLRLGLVVESPFCWVEMEDSLGLEVNPEGPTKVGLPPRSLMSKVVDDVLDGVRLCIFSLFCK